MLKKNIRGRLYAGMLAFIMTMTSVGPVPITAYAKENDSPLDISELYDVSDEIEVVDITSLNAAKLDTESIVESVFSIDENAASYDPRPKNRVTSVKNQGKEGLCWDYAANAAAESALIYQGLEKNSVDLSEIYFAYTTYKNQQSTRSFSEFCNDGNNARSFNTRVGNEYIGKFAYESAFPMPESIKDDYKLTDSQLDNYSYRVSRIFKINDYKPDENTIKKVKHLISEFGGATWNYYSQSLLYQKGVTSASIDTNYYCPEFYVSNHCVEVVGWNDNYAASNFKNTPPGNGAWLVKNSWGVNQKIDYDFDEDKWLTTGTGYMWISYYNDSYGDGVNAMEVVPKGTETYENKTINVNIYDTIDLKDIAKEKPSEWRKIIDDRSYSKVKNTSIKCNSYGQTKYTAYDDYDNLIGIYTINVVAPDKADYKLDLIPGLEIDVTGRLLDETTGTRILEVADKAGINGTLSAKKIKYTTTLDKANVNSEVVSSDNDIVEVNDDGYLYIKGFGKAIITATYVDNIITGGKEYKSHYIVNVKEKSSEIKWNDGTDSKWIDLNMGAVYQISDINTVPAGHDLVYKSSDDSILKVTDKGLVTVVGYGNANIIINPEDNDYCYAYLYVNVLVCNSMEIEGAIDAYGLHIGDTYQLNVKTDTDNEILHYSSADSSVATISSNGLITAVGEGYTEIQICPDSNPGYYITFYVGVVSTISDGSDYNTYDNTIYYTTDEVIPNTNYLYNGDSNTFGHDTNSLNSNTSKVKKVGKTNLLKVKNKKKGKLTLSYKASGAKKYELQISPNKKFAKKVKTYRTTKTTYTIKKLKKGKKYYVRVRGLNGKIQGKWSKIKEIKIKK